MSDAQPTSPPGAAAAPAVTWRRRALRRTAGSLGAAVVLAAVGPAVANAAGADVANPVAIALRASGETLKDAFGAADVDEEEGATECVTPSVAPSAEVSTAPAETVSADPDAPVSADPSGEPVVEPTPEPTLVADPSAEPTLEADASAEPSAEPSAAGDECVTTTDATPEPTEPAAETEDGDTGHGQVVSTVARCAPKGKDRLLDVEGAPGNHGGYVKAAAHGDSLTLPWGTYDLSTQAGADELCASLDAARAALPEEPAADKAKGKKDKGDRGRPEKAERAKDAKGTKGGDRADAGAGRGHGKKQR